MQTSELIEYFSLHFFPCYAELGDSDLIFLTKAGF